MELPPSIRGHAARFCEETWALQSYSLFEEDICKFLTDQRVSELGAALYPVRCFVVDSPEPELAASAVLSDGAFVAALLRTFAFLTWGTHERLDYPTQADPAVANLHLDVGYTLTKLTLHGHRSERMVKSLVRMQTPQCLSRRLSEYALAAEELRALLADRAAAAAAGVEAEGELDYVPALSLCSRTSWMIGLLASLALHALHLRVCVDQAGSEASASAGGPTTDGAPTALGRRRRRAGAAGNAQQQSRQLQEEQQRAAVLAERKGCLQELEAALSESGVVEHAARAVLLLMEVASSATGGAATAGTPWANIGVALLNWAELMRVLSSMHSPSFAAGPCARHLAIACGLAVLCEADGGAAYGMPNTVLSVLGAAGVTSAGVGVPPTAREGVVDPLLKTFTYGLDLLSPSLPSQPLLLRRGAIRSLLLRFGHWAVASAREWASMEEEGPVGSATESAAATPDAATAPGASAPAVSPPAAGAGSQPVGPEATGGPSGASVQATGPPMRWTGQPGQARRLPLLLERGMCCAYALGTLQTSQSLLPPAGSHAAAAKAAAADWWRLAVAAALHAMRGSDETLQEAMAKALSLEPLALGHKEGVLPPVPPPPVAAALGGGLLGCTEALLRRAGRDPGGHEAGILTHLAYGAEEGEAPWYQFAPLLAYGEPRGAASLIATMRKVLRRALPPLVMVCAQQSSGLAVGSELKEFFEAVQQFACRVLEEGHAWLCAAVAASNGLGGAQARAAAAQGAAVPTASAAPPGVASAAQRQLASMLSYALCSWLPVLSRHSAMAYVLPRSAGSRGAISYPLLCGALLPHLRWLPVLARGVAVSPRGPPPQPAQPLRDGAAEAAAAPATPSMESSQPGPAAHGVHWAAADVVERATATDFGGWRSFVLEDVGAVPLVGLALNIGPRMIDSLRLGAFLQQLADSAVALAAACPQEVRRAAIKGTAASGGSGWVGHGLRQSHDGSGGWVADNVTWAVHHSVGALHNVLCLAGGPAGEDSRPHWYPSAAQWLAAKEAGGGSSENMPSVEVPVWPPAAVRSLAALPEARGAAASRLRALASQLERWAAGQDAGSEPGGTAGGASGGGEGGSSGGAGEGGSSSGAGGGSSSNGAARGGVTHGGSLDAVLRALTPPAEARRLLRTCAYPGCVNLEGDSEADLPLQACSRCGEAWYCGRGCQLAHWRAGHRAACERSRQAAALRKG